MGLDEGLPLLVLGLVGRSLGIHGHVLYPVRHSAGKGVYAVVVGQGTLVLSDAGHLVEQAVLGLILDPVALDELVVVADHALVDDEAVLVHDRLQRLDDAEFLHAVGADILDLTEVAHSPQVGLQERGEHPLPEVGFDLDVVHAVAPCVLRDAEEDSVIVATLGPHNAEHEDEPVEDRCDGPGGLVSASAGRVDEHDP